MNIELHCQGCGKLIRAPRDAAGRRAQCPACGRELYIPTPAAKLEELPLAPEDTTLLQHEAALQAERRRLDSILRRDTEASGEPPTRRPATPSRESRAGSVPEAVMA